MRLWIQDVFEASIANAIRYDGLAAGRTAAVRTAGGFFSDVWSQVVGVQPEEDILRLMEVVPCHGMDAREVASRFMAVLEAELCLREARPTWPVWEFRRR